MGLSPQQIASRINSASNDPHSASSYSIVIVHPWTKTVDDVEQTIDLLNPDVVILKPSDFIQDIKDNVQYS